MSITYSGNNPKLKGNNCQELFIRAHDRTCLGKISQKVSSGVLVSYYYYGSQRPASFAKSFASSISNFGMLNSLIGVTLHWLVIFCGVTKASSLEEPKSVI